MMNFFGMGVGSPCEGCEGREVTICGIKICEHLEEKIGKGKNTVSFEMIAIKSNTCNMTCYILCESM